MNIFYKAYCRIYQGVFKLVAYILPWRDPFKIEGVDSLILLPEYLKSKHISRLQIITDKNINQLGLINPLKDALDKAEIFYTVYDKTVPNPTIDNVEEGLLEYRKNYCQALIAFGGGSPMDCAKAIGARVVRPKKPVQKMRGVLKIRRRLPLLVAVPTTSGTGSEATLAAVICNLETHEKFAINDTSLIPSAVVLDPNLTAGLPKHITSTTGMDALTHAVEAFIGKSNTRKTKRQALEATKLIFENLKTAYDKPSDIKARTAMQNAALLAGCAFTRAYVGYVHAVAHTLSGFYGTAHGLANAVILPYVLDEYGSSVYRKLSKLAAAAGIKAASSVKKDKAKAFIEEIRKMNAYMEIPEKISGIKEADVSLMIKRAMKEAHPLYPTPQIWKKEKFEKILESIME